MSLDLHYFIDFNELLHAELFPANPFDLLGNSLKTWLNALLSRYNVGEHSQLLGQVDPSAKLSGSIYLAESARIGPGVSIEGPAFIGPEAEIRHTAFLRGPVYVGRGCVVGHATEVKGSCFFDGAKASHLSYVGDSLLGRNCNLGAGTKLANVKLRKNEVFYEDPVSRKKLGSSLRKFGSILGDSAQTGCNAVLSPGSILCRNTAVLPCTHFHGTLREGIS